VQSMPRWIGSSTPVLVAGVFALLFSEGRAQQFNVIYYSNSACTTPLVTKSNINLAVCDTLNNAVVGDGMSRGYKILCAKDTSQVASYAATVLLINVDPAGCGISADGATTYIGMPQPDVCWHIQGSRNVWLKWSYPSTATTLCGETLPSPSPTPSVSGDPITWHGNVREEFWLPHTVLSPLIRSPDMQVLASSVPGHKEDQWINRIVITSGLGEPVLDVKIIKNLTYFNRGSLPPNAFETLDVKMEWWRPGVVGIMPPGDAQFNHWSGISMGFGRVRHYGQLNAGAAPRREAVYIVSKHLKILILSSAAREYFLESGHLGMEYSHLDLEIMEIADQKQITGILPELWGMLPMSEETKVLRKMPPVGDAYDELPNIKEIEGNTTGAENCSSVGGNGSSPMIISTDAGSCSTSDSQISSFSQEISSGAAVPVASVEGLSPNPEEVKSMAAAL